LALGAGDYGFFLIGFPLFLPKKRENIAMFYGYSLGPIRGYPKKENCSVFFFA
jgi:hypothetical protein